MIESTGKFRVKQIVYNRDGFAIAVGNWDGNDNLTAACRWHDEEGIGYPQTFGKPQWMNLPPNVRVDVEDLTGHGKVTVTFP
ncbi:MAG: hypothetical protein ACTJHW_03880 [Paenalcaligenes sp.]